MSNNDIPPSGANAPGPGPYGPDPSHPQGSSSPGYGPHHGPQGAGPRPNSSDRFFQSVRQIGIVRTEDRWGGGVAGGVARRFGLDPLLVRGLLAVSLLIAGVGLVLYAFAWALLPEELDGRIHFQEMLRGNFDGALLGALLLLLMGFGWEGMGIFPFPWSGHWFGHWFGGLLWFAAVGGLIALIVVTVNKQRPSNAGPSNQAPPHGRAGYGPAEGGPAAHGAATSDTSDHRASGHDQRTGGSTADGPGPQGARSAPYGAGPNVSGSYGPKPPSPPRVHGPGAMLVGVFMGLWILSVAGLLIADRTGYLTASVATLSIGLLAGAAGIGVVIAGLRGRTAGSLGAIGVFAIILSLPTTIWSTTNLDVGNATRAGFSSETFQPTTAAKAREGYAMIAGDWVVDLSDVPASNHLLEVPVTMAAGDLTIKVPSEVAWVADVRLLAGEINVTTPTGSKSRSGLLMAENTFSGDAVTVGADPTVRLVIRGAAGEITIVEEQS